ncbi:MAG: 5-formyltetrahydrofolate cyclo-ligase [Candidatus Phaeomarinobacter sp.]
MTSTPFDGLSKPQLREVAGLVRQDAARRLAGREAELIARQTVEGLPLRTQETVAGYWPVRGEADPRHAMLALQALGHRLALPVVVGKDQPLAFRSWRPGEPLVAGGYGIPAPSLAAPLVTPTLLLVPGLWFDRSGVRLGYGGGFYDRTLERLRAGWQPRAVGITYDSTFGGHLDREPHDAVMDFIVTERRVVRTA